MSEFVWCDKEEQFKNFKVCQKRECAHLEPGPSCSFENAESKRRRKAQEKVIKKSTECIK